ncbi:MAG: hypothetical protein ACC628_25335 [Pirellulaceae bacterium]
MHQYQRKKITRSRGSDTQRCVIATPQDLQWANRLAGEALGVRKETLLPQTRLLLEQLDAYVNQRSQAKGAARLDVRFTQRELREALRWPDRALRRQLNRLVELEYVLVYRTGRGNQRAYQLLYDGQATEAASVLLGLTEAKQLSKNQKRPPRKAAPALPR